MRPRNVTGGKTFLGIAAAILMNGCVGSPPQSEPPSELRVPCLKGAVKVDGNLNEDCYRQPPIVSDFVIAGQPRRRPARTKAWLFWNREEFVFAFDCDDAGIVASPPTTNKHDVDLQDRVELFLWSGRKADAYYCIEIAGGGAVHDYKARFYRRFDDAWSPRGWEYGVKPRDGGFRVEASLSRAALQQMGLRLRAGEHWRVGLFRADFAPGKPDAPDWITWVDARTPRPDFHVAGAFGRTVLAPCQQQGRARQNARWPPH